MFYSSELRLKPVEKAEASSDLWREWALLFYTEDS